jgi:small redox-active disulfide protein 2
MSLLRKYPAAFSSTGVLFGVFMYFPTLWRLPVGEKQMGGQCTVIEVKILGPGCAKCKHLEQVAREAAAQAGIEAQFTKVSDLSAIMAYPILGTPGLVINEQLKSAGRIPQKDEIVNWLKQAAA